MLPLLPAGRSLLLARALAWGSRGTLRAYAEAAAAAASPAGQAQMAFTFASPSQVFYNAANVKQVDVPTLSGSFGILAAHVPTLQVLKPGVVAKSNLEKALAEVAAASDEAAKAEAQIRVEASEAIVKALE
ncbi:hypothetical protein JD844_034070 [Phrynosoma platyrhinos]|uniref:F1F0-ATP synthase delta subunit C-terminal domain-containing protein n=1 Tax=Phrynosoma platyrhinos TaxID=52577 RepID=A0ABQ7T7V5_PHRPL|nr:hypothetical protein JD844_034070 [Phrynosoma platyrhinos]